MGTQNIIDRAEQLRRETAEKVLSALRSFGQVGATTRQLAEAAGVSGAACRRHLAEMRAENVARVCDYAQIKCSLAEMWALGDSPDLTKAQWRRRRQPNAEAEMQKEVQSKHARWMNAWRPQRAPEAFWIR